MVHNRRHTVTGSALAAWAQKRKSTLVHVALAGAVLLYMALGALVFMWLEADAAELDRDTGDYGGSGKGLAKSTELTVERRHCLVGVLNDTLWHDASATFNGSNATSQLEHRMALVQRCLSDGGEVPWTFAQAILFTFTVITTIGYGNVAPITVLGRLFCIVYGLVGIPLTMMAIANIGKFLVEAGKRLATFFTLLWRRTRRWRHSRRRSSCRFYGGGRNCKSSPPPIASVTGNCRSGVDNAGSVLDNCNNNDTRMSLQSVHIQVDPCRDKVDERDDQRDEQAEDNTSSAAGSDTDPDDEFSATVQTALVIGAFAVYVGFGGFVLPLYENMTFFTAVYFNFVTLTTVGLGDMVPKRTDFLVLTLAYIIVGLALTTIAIEVASEYLQKLHYVGRKVTNAGRKSAAPPTMKHVTDFTETIVPQFELQLATEGYIHVVVHSRPTFLALRGELAPTQIEIVPIEWTEPIADCIQSMETATEKAVGESNLESRLNAKHLFKAKPVRTTAATHRNETCTQDVLPAEEPKKPRPKLKRGPKFDLSTVNDPKLRYELYQREWTKYNAQFLEAKNYKEFKEKNPEGADGGSSSKTRSSHGTTPLPSGRTSPTHKHKPKQASGSGGVSIAHAAATAAAAVNNRPPPVTAGKRARTSTGASTSTASTSGRSSPSAAAAVPTGAGGRTAAGAKARGKAAPIKTGYKSKSAAAQPRR